MNRRVFLAQLTAAVGAAPILSATRLSAFQGAGAQSIPPAVMQRIGITTVCFRNRFRQTAPKDAAGKADLTLLAAPKFIADSLGIHNVEVWNAHFENESLGLLRAGQGCSGQGRLADSPTSSWTRPTIFQRRTPRKRAESITFVKGWMDRAKAVGAPMLRANTGPERPGAAFEPEHHCRFVQTAGRVRQDASASKF